MATATLSWLDLALMALATWRLAHMLTREAGPFKIFERLRERLPLGGLTSCIYCLSMWMAIVVYVIHLLIPVVVWIAAISGAALMLRSYTGVGHDA